MLVRDLRLVEMEAIVLQPVKMLVRGLYLVEMGAIVMQTHQAVV